MEEELGVELLVRTPHGVNLTEQGSYFAQGFNEILADYDTLLLNVKSKAVTEKKTIHVLASLGSMEAFLADVISTFLSKERINRVQVLEGSYSEIIDGIKNGTADLGIAVFAGENQLGDTEEELICIPLFSSSLFVRVSEKSPLAEYNSISLESLKGETVLIYNNQHWQHSYMKETLDALAVNMNYVMEENYQLHSNMIRHGHGIAFGVMDGKFYKQEHGIKYIKINNAVEVKASCFLKRGRETSPELQLFINHLQMECNK